MVNRQFIWVGGGIGRPACAGRRDRFMFWVYIIKSYTNNWYYVGLTSNLDKRFNQHNNGYEATTRSYKPFYLIFAQEFTYRKDARGLEKFLKIRSNKEKFLEIM